MLTVASLRAMRRRAEDNRRTIAAPGGRPVNSLRAQLAQAATDVERLTAEVERLRQALKEAR